MARKAAKDLTQKRLESLLKKPGTYTDRSLPGFGVDVKRGGEAYFGVRYFVRGTLVRRFRGLGRYGTVTLTEAREAARVILSAVSLGGDPIGDAEAVPTWTEWTKRYFARITAKSKESFHKYLLGMNEEKSKFGKPTDSTFREIRARWGSRRLDSFRAEDIEAERQRIREAKGDATSNRWLAVIAGAFSEAVRMGLIGKSPAAGLRQLREAQPRTRVLSPEETRRLLAALALEEDRFAVAVVLLALLAGARRGEALGLKWEQVDLTTGMAVMPDSKSGKRRHLPLVPYLVKYLESLPRMKSSPYVVASEGEKPRPDIKNAWRRITKTAELDDVGLHDLRRTYGLSLSRVAGLRVAQEGLGHSSPDVTASTYTPEGFDSVKAAAEKAAEALGLVN